MPAAPWGRQCPWWLWRSASDLILGITGAFSVGYLPLHLCSVAMFICLYAAWHPRSDTVGQLLWSLCFSGGLAALLFPNWTKLPLWHFLSIHSFIYHAMLVQFSLIAVITGPGPATDRETVEGGALFGGNRDSRCIGSTASCTQIICSSTSL